MAKGLIGGSVGAAAMAILLAFAPNPSSAGAASASASTQLPQDQLGAALTADMKDVRLQVSTADLDAGKPAKASVILPRDLLARVRAEAGKLNLDKAASRIAIRAKLSGDGYDISPNRKESARLTGRATGFHWRVKRSGTGPAPLNVHLTGVLHGDGASKSFVLADLTVGAPATAAPTPVIAASVPAAAAPARAVPAVRSGHGKSARTHGAPREHGLGRLKLPSFSFSAPDVGDVKIGGRRIADIMRVDGMPPQKLAIGAGLLALAILLWAVALGAARRKARDERRRRFRTFEPPRYFNEPSREA
jgi:hypothetical protein